MGATGGPSGDRPRWARRICRCTRRARTCIRLCRRGCLTTRTRSWRRTRASRRSQSRTVRTAPGSRR